MPKKLGNAKPVFILINPDTKTISAIDHLNQNQILDLLQDEAVDIKSIGKMQIITGLKALSSPNIPATLLKLGGGETVRISGPALLMPKRGYFWDETIIESLVDDLLQTATFIDPASEASGL